MFRFWSILPNYWSKKAGDPGANGGMILPLGSLSCGGNAMDISGVLPVKAVEVMCNGCAVCPIPAVSSLNSKLAGWTALPWNRSVMCRASRFRIMIIRLTS